MTSIPDTPVMTTGEVAQTFRVASKTVNEWVRSGKLKPAFRTLGGHCRFHEADVLALMNGGGRS